MKTTVYFIRHAESDHSCREDRIRPLTKTGIRDSRKLVKVMEGIQIDAFYSSPYVRSIRTILDVSKTRNAEEEIVKLEGFRERETGPGGNTRKEFRKRWEAFHYHEPGGESLKQCQDRNIDALMQVLAEQEGNTVVVGTHGTALSTIIHYFEPSYGVDDFYRMMHFLPFVLKMEFEGTKYLGKTEIYKSDKKLKRTLQRKLRFWYKGSNKSERKR